MHHSLLGLIILLIDVWGIISVISSNRDTATKALWVVLILVLPLVGALLWLVFGPRAPIARI